MGKSKGDVWQPVKVQVKYIIPFPISSDYAICVLDRASPVDPFEQVFTADFENGRPRIAVEYCNPVSGPSRCHLRQGLCLLLHLLDKLFYARFAPRGGEGTGESAMEKRIKKTLQLGLFIAISK